MIEEVEMQTAPPVVIFHCAKCKTNHNMATTPTVAVAPGVISYLCPLCDHEMGQEITFR